jgi:hypothetical protein
MTRTGIKLDLDVGDMVSNAGRARGAISALTDAMKEAEQKGNWDDYNRLSFDRDRLQSRNTGFERDLRALVDNPRFQTKAADGTTVLKIDAEYAASFKSLTDSIKKLTIEYEEAVKTNDFSKTRELAPQIERQQADLHKVMEDANKPTGIQAMAGAMKAIGVNQIANAINDGFSRWVGSLDRSGIINQYGGGDIWGGRIAEERRQADFTGGILQSVLAIGGTALGFALGGPGGAMLGGTVGGGAGKAIATGLQGPINNEASEAAYAGLWQNRSGQAMELAAIMGTPGDVRGSFKTAADTAVRFGYSAEEGMEALKEAARQGLGGQEAADITSRVFDYERRTGADRGTLTGISTMSARYGAGDALGMGWAGLQASGMKPGQYNEYLRAMQRVMEDGISKGFIRSSEQVVENLTMLARMANNDPLWQGENGARRLSEMNAGLESATALQSSSDIIAFRAARNIAERRNGGKPVDYVDAQMVLEEGMTTELFKEIMPLVEKAEGRGRNGMFEQIRDIFGMSRYKNANVVYEAWTNPEIRAKLDDKSLRALIDKNKNEPPPADSPELKAAITIEEIKNWWTETGISHWDANFPNTLLEELRKGKGEYNPVDTSGMTPVEAVRVRQREYMEAVKSGNPIWVQRASAALEKANMEALSPKPVIDPLDEEARARMLLKSDGFWDSGRIAFFTGTANPFTKNDDERAFDRLKAYEQFPEARQALDKAYDIMRSMTPDMVKKANESNKINDAIPLDIMTDRTGQALLRAIENMKITLEESQ